MSLSKTLYLPLSTCSRAEYPSQHDLKIVERDVKNQTKQTNQDISELSTTRVITIKNIGWVI